jgi:hypothetical protein
VKPGKTIVLDCGMLLIEWQHAEDRWHHCVGTVVEGAFRSAMQSVEGRADEFWPPSAALQELHVESRGEDMVAFLTGMAGTNHWSASVLGERKKNRAIFELACRCKRTPGWLGSTYALDESLSPQYSPQTVLLRMPSGANLLQGSSDDVVCDASPGARFPGIVHEGIFTPSLPGQDGVDRRTTCFAPRMPLENEHRTVRWKYTLEVVAG